MMIRVPFFASVNKEQGRRIVERGEISSSSLETFLRQKNATRRLKKNLQYFFVSKGICWMMGKDLNEKLCEKSANTLVCH